jgi:tRNA A37 N6-isopentenylltransferase MiaA
MKMATRQYARSQVKWITSKLRGTVKERVEESKEGLFLLDAGDLDKWDEKVLGPAVKVLDGESVVDLPS